MLNVYIDDSGSIGTRPVFVLAGYMLRDAHVETFTEDWQRVLDSPNPAVLAYFKANDAVQLDKKKSQFYRWSEVERDARLREFAIVIRRHVLRGIAVVVPLDAYKNIISGKFGPEAMDRPYFAAFFAIASICYAKFRELYPNEKIELVFDEQKNEPIDLIIEEYEKFCGLCPPHLRAMIGSGPIFKDDREVLPLQAADMLAWHMRRYYHEVEIGNNPEKHRSHQFLANIWEPEHDVIEVLSPEILKEMAERMLEGRRQR